MLAKDMDPNTRSAARPPEGVQCPHLAAGGPVVIHIDGSSREFKAAKAFNQN